MKQVNKSKSNKKPGKWTVFKASYKRLAEEEVCLTEGDVKEEPVQTTGKKESKKFIKRASKRVKKATWSALKAIYQGLVYSSQAAYPVGVPGVDPWCMPHSRMPMHIPRGRNTDWVY